MVETSGGILSETWSPTDSRMEDPMSDAIDHLKREHETILLSLKILGRFNAAIDSGRTPPRTDLADCVGFLKEFADRCHHGKEENVLFPALVEAGFSDPSGSIEAMISEHLLGRDYVRTMDLATSSGPDCLTFAYAARQYASLLHHHIQKEDDVLFPMAERALDAARLGKMSQSFEEYEVRTIGRHRRDELNQKLEELRRKYLQ
jgi:hemerythrin-like domain-containing protein